MPILTMSAYLCIIYDSDEAIDERVILCLAYNAWKITNAACERFNDYCCNSQLENISFSGIKWSIT